MSSRVAFVLALLLGAAEPPAAEERRCERRWTFPVPFFQSAAWSPDGTTIAYAAVTTSWDEGYRIHLVDVESGAARQLETGEGAALFPAFSPDGARAQLVP